MEPAGSNNAPPAYLVIPHFIFGGLTLLVVASLIVIYPGAFTRHFFNPHLLSITHLLVLGWIAMVIFGVLYQLIPVIMEVKIFSEKLALASFFSLAAGAVLLPIAFANFWVGAFLNISAMFILTAVILLAINIFVTVARSGKENIQKNFILTSIVWLLFTVSMGLMLAINLSSPFLKSSHIELLKLHAHAGIVGWILQMIIGVGSRLFPMFMVAHHLNEKKLGFAWYFINAGLVCGIISLYIQWQPGVAGSVFLVIAGILFFISFLVEAYKKRVKKHLDIGMRQSVISFLILLLPLLIVVVLTAGPESLKGMVLPMSVAYGSALLFGFVTSLIMGQTYKILPLVIWMKLYSKQLGKERVPLPKDLYSEKLAIIQVWLFAAGFIILLSGIFAINDFSVRISGMVLFGSIVLYNVNMLRIVFKKPVFLQKKTNEQRS